MKTYQTFALIIGLMLASAGLAHAQESPVMEAAAKPKSAFIIQGGIGLGGFRTEEHGALYNYRRWHQPKEFSVEWKRWRAFGIGLYGGWYNQEYVFDTYQTSFIPPLGFVQKNVGYAKISKQFISGGLRATFHLTAILSEALNVRVNPDRVDFYTAVLGGLTHMNKSEMESLRGLEPGTYSPEHTSWFGEDMRWQLGVVGGVRLMPTKHLGIYFEGGLGPLSPAQIGAVVRF